jgi:hypothetical protein
LKTKILKNGNIKVWWDREEDFTIVGKNEPLYDSLIDANLTVKKHSKQLVKEIKDAGLDDIHGVFIQIDSAYEARLDKLEHKELEKVFNDFNTIFKTSLSYHLNDNGMVSIIFGKFDTYQEFVQNYFATFLIKIFAFRVNIMLSETKETSLKRLSDFIERFVPKYSRAYITACKKLVFTLIIDTCE